mgnify:CR=1 FL=1
MCGVTTNDRFEEEGGGAIVSYSRNVQGSLRRKDDKRKRQREARRLRKEHERKERDEEVKRLKVRRRPGCILQGWNMTSHTICGCLLTKRLGCHLPSSCFAALHSTQNMKLQELRSQVGQVAEAAGAELNLAPEDMDSDFDPDAHDRRMAELFNDDYYEGEEEDVGEDGWELGVGQRPQWAAVDDVMPDADEQETQAAGEGSSGDGEGAGAHTDVAMRHAAQSLPRTASGEIDVDSVGVLACAAL